MPTPESLAIQAFVPARDFEQSKNFYQDLGFDMPWASEQVAYCRLDETSFLLQNFYVREHAENFMMHMLVADVEAWWQHVQSLELPERYGTRLEPPEDREWGVRDFVLVDPSGVLWRIGETRE